jgi:hypothetical protein
MFGGSTGMFNTGGFGVGSTFATGTALGASVGCCTYVDTTTY